jgi:hypothetical protein
MRRSDLCRRRVELMAAAARAGLSPLEAERWVADQVRSKARSRDATCALFGVEILKDALRRKDGRPDAAGRPSGVTR